MFALSARSSSLKAASSRAARNIVAPRVGGVALPKRSVIVRAEKEGEFNSDEFSTKAQAAFNDAVTFVKTKWEATPDNEKPAAIAIIVGVTVAQIAIGATVDAVDKLPILSDLFELLGFIVLAVFGYKLATDPAERETLKKSVDGFLSSVTGK